MTIPSQTRDLARRLITYESKADKFSMPSAPMAPPSLRVYEKLRLSLGAFAGDAGFLSLATRALSLAKSEAPTLSEARIAADGSLLGWGRAVGEIEHPIGMEKNTVDEFTVDEEGLILIAHLLGLLQIFLGEVLTVSLLRVTWPEAALNERNSA